MWMRIANDDDHLEHEHHICCLQLEKLSAHTLAACLDHLIEVHKFHLCILFSFRWQSFRPCVALRFANSDMAFAFHSNGFLFTKLRLAKNNGLAQLSTFRCHPMPRCRQFDSLNSNERMRSMNSVNFCQLSTNATFLTMFPSPTILMSTLLNHIPGIANGRAIQSVVSSLFHFDNNFDCKDHLEWTFAFEFGQKILHLPGIFSPYCYDPTRSVCSH